LLALYNNGFIERLPSLYNFWCHFTRFVFVFPAALPHRAPKTKATVLKDLAESRTLDIPAPTRTHLPLDHGLVDCCSDFPHVYRTRFSANSVASSTD